MAAKVAKSDPFAAAASGVAPNRHPLRLFAPLHLAAGTAGRRRLSESKEAYLGWPGGLPPQRVRQLRRGDKALSGDLDGGPLGLLSPGARSSSRRQSFSFCGFARSLQIGDGVAVIAVTSGAANLSTILAGLEVLEDRLATNVLVVGVRIAAFVPTLVGVVLIRTPLPRR